MCSVRLSVNHYVSKRRYDMTIEKRLYIQMREPAIATCNNSYLMASGEILTNEQFKRLSFVEKLQVQLVYNYSSGQVIKV